MLLCWLPLALAACGEPPRQNVVLVTFDTTRADHFGAYGNTEIRTPVVDALAADGVLFERAYSAVPVTAPSHSTILTGTYPPTHGVRDNGLFVLTEGQTTLAEVLRQNGYATAAAVASFPLDSKFGLDQGFDLYDDRFDAAYENVLGQRVQPKSGLFFDERKAAQVNEAIFPWLETHHQEPFFIWLHYFDPHHPHEPPSPYDDLYPQDLYLGEIAYADESLGTVIERLRQLGVWDNTLLVMTSDHGEGKGEHNEMTHSTLAYNSTLHVPMVMHLPEGKARDRGRRVTQRVGTVDIVPTVLDFLAIEPPSTLQGQSLRPLIEGDGERTAVPTLYAETLAPRFSHNLGELRVLFHRQLKYIFGPRPELYDLEADPDELDNLIDRDADSAAAMYQRLQAFLADHAPADPAALLEIDTETRARLEALGYIQTDGGTPTIDEELDGTGTPPQDRVADVNDVSTAKNFLHQKNPAAAKEVALKLLRRAPDNAFYLQLKASAELQLNQLEEALATIAVIRQKDPRGLPAEGLLFQLTTVLHYRGRSAEALAILQDAQSVQPSALGQWHLASLHSALGQPEKAVTALRKALELTPELAPARVDLAAFHAMAGDLDTAQKELERALADLPYYPKGHYNFATLQLQKGDPEAALRYFNRAVELEPAYLRAHYARIATALQVGRRAQADTYLATLIETAPDSDETSRAKALLESTP